MAERSGGGGKSLSRNEQAKIRRWHDRHEKKPRPDDQKEDIGRAFMAGVRKRRSRKP